MDGVEDLVTGWSDGTIDVREDRSGASGETMLRDTFGGSGGAVAGLAAADYRMDGTRTLLAVSAEGEARGYLPLGVKLKLDEVASPSEVAHAPAKAKKKAGVQEGIQGGAAASNGRNKRSPGRISGGADGGSAFVSSGGGGTVSADAGDESATAGLGR
jgi:hypothetical protein